MWSALRRVPGGPVLQCEWLCVQFPSRPQTTPILSLLSPPPISSGPPSDIQEEGIRSPELTHPPERPRPPPREVGVCFP